MFATPTLALDHIAQEVKVLDRVLPKVENKKGPKSLAPKEAETDIKEAKDNGSADGKTD